MEASVNKAVTRRYGVHRGVIFSSVQFCINFSCRLKANVLSVCVCDSRLALIEPSRFAVRMAYENEIESFFRTFHLKNIRIYVKEKLFSL